MPRAPQRVQRDPARQTETVSAAAPPAPVTASLTPAALLSLQRTAGNAAVARMLARATPEEAASAPPAAVTDVTIVYGADADPAAVSADATAIVKQILSNAGVTNATISSTARDANGQARVMFQNCETAGTAAQRRLYGSYGGKVIDIYEEEKKAGKTPDEIKKAMEDKINELGPTNVSHHTVDPTKLTVVDIAPSSIPPDKQQAVVDAAKAAVGTTLSKFLDKDSDDPAYHFEITAGTKPAPAPAPAAAPAPLPRRALARDPAAPAAALPSADELTARIATAIGVYETNRSGDEPNPVESRLDTAAGVSASMATIEQATMSYSLTTLKKYESLRQKASPELTMKELNDAEARCIAVSALLDGVGAAARRHTTAEDYIKANAAAMESTGMDSDDVKRMFDAVALKAKVDAAHAKGTRAADAAAAIPEAERVGMDTESLTSYIADPRKWGENEAAWQRLAVQRMPGDIAARIEAVAESDGGTGLVGPVTRTRVDAQLGKTPQPSEEALVKAVAAQNNPGAKAYADGVWAVYQRLPAPPPPAPVDRFGPRPVPGLY